MPAILPVEKYRTTPRVAKSDGNLLIMLFTFGLDRTLERICTISVFSVLSVA